MAQHKYGYLSFLLSPDESFASQENMDAKRADNDSDPTFGGQKGATPRPCTRAIVDPAYPLLHANASFIRSIKQATFTYGSTEVHQLDVYYPPHWEDYLGDPSQQPIILVFFHGGGLTHGSRSSPPSYLVHNNLGSFFASRGILTVIPDYRLVPSITFPQGSEDVRDALNWVVSHFPPDATGNRCRVFVLGHSAGGLHVTGFMLTSMLATSLVKSALRGVALLGVPYDIQRSKPRFRDAAQQYYGNQKKVNALQPLSLLRSADNADVTTLPPVRNIIAESEPRSVSSSASIFTDLFKEKGGSITQHVLLGHDHVSPILALGSGSGEEWGEELVSWIRYLVSAP